MVQSTLTFRGQLKLKMLIMNSARTQAHTGEAKAAAAVGGPRTPSNDGAPGSALTGRLLEADGIPAPDSENLLSGCSTCRHFPPSPVECKAAEEVTGPSAAAHSTRKADSLNRPKEHLRTHITQSG